MQSVFTFSLFKKSTMNSPTLSLPTAVSKLVRSPSREQATAMFRGDPPTKASNPLISLKGEPMFWEYKSIEDLPKVITSYFFLAIFYCLFICAVTKGNRSSFVFHEP